MLPGVSLLFAYAATREGEWRAHTSVETLELGVGKTAAAASLTRRLMQGPRVHAVVLVGVCGAYPEEHLSGGSEGRTLLDLCVVSRESFGDEGVLTPDGFLSVRDLGFADDVPLAACEARSARVAKLLGAHTSVGLTVSSCSGTDELSRIRGGWGAAVESMEGASVAFVCQHHQIPWVQLRCVSNYTGDRAPEKWRLDEALERLAEATRSIAEMEGLA